MKIVTPVDRKDVIVPIDKACKILEIMQAEGYKMPEYKLAGMLKDICIITYTDAKTYDRAVEIQSTL